MMHLFLTFYKKLAEMPGVAQAGWLQKYLALFGWAIETAWTLWRRETRSRGNGLLTTFLGQQSLLGYFIVGALPSNTRHCSGFYKKLVKVKVTLRPMTSRSVSPGFKAHEGLTT
jgi:hypothetical protein